MKITTQMPSKEYPYLAVWVGRDTQLDNNLLHNVKQEDIVIISMLPVENSDNQTYVSFVTGTKEGYFTKNENEYCPLPKGFALNLVQ